MDFLLAIAPSGDHQAGQFVSGRDGLIYIKGPLRLGASLGSMARDMFFSKIQERTSSYF
jgi:hypothetical protein